MIRQGNGPAWLLRMSAPRWPKFQQNRTMITARDMVQDRGVDQPGRQVLADEEVIQAPANVA